MSSTNLVTESFHQNRGRTCTLNDYETMHLGHHGQSAYAPVSRSQLHATRELLFIPATDASVDTDSYHEFGTGRFLARGFMKYGWDLYAPDEKTRNSPYISPLRATNKELKGLPPALVITVENDPLRNEGEAYARRLKEAGVAVAATRYNGMIHDFVLLHAIHEVSGVQAALAQASDAIRDALKP